MRDANFNAGLQPATRIGQRTWGVAPGYYNPGLQPGSRYYLPFAKQSHLSLVKQYAPFLTKYVECVTGGEVVCSANGASHNSLGQRPRKACVSRQGLKARYIVPAYVSGFHPSVRKLTRYLGLRPRLLCGALLALLFPRWHGGSCDRSNLNASTYVSRFCAKCKPRLAFGEPGAPARNVKARKPILTAPDANNTHSILTVLGVHGMQSRLRNAL